MSQSSNPADYVKMGQSILQKMTLASTAITEAALKAIAQKAKGSLRDFVNDVVFAALKLGGVLPQ
jgi:biotin-(acetyl-CoA carboxylase) ligase